MEQHFGMGMWVQTQQTHLLWGEWEDVQVRLRECLLCNRPKSIGHSTAAVCTMVTLEFVKQNIFIIIIVVISMEHKMRRIQAMYRRGNGE